LLFIEEKERLLEARRGYYSLLQELGKEVRTMEVIQKKLEAADQP
jgi:hypothetical protein